MKFKTLKIKFLRGKVVSINDKIEYQGIQLMHNLRNYNKGVNFNILVTNEYEFNLAKKYFINKKLKFKYFDY